MAIRKTKHIIKNSDIVNRPLPTDLLKGEAIVNTADGIMWFSGVTTSTQEWTPAGTGATANYFEVGSNLYDLRLRNKITHYQDITGAGLSGKFLSGTTNGFVLADISDIANTTDSFTTGGTYNKATSELTLNLNLGRPDVVITGITDFYVTGASLVNTTVYFDRNDSLSAFTLDLSTLDTNDTFVTGLTYNNSTLTISRNEGEPDLTTTIDTFTSATITNLTSGRVVYVGTGGLLTDNAGFTYDDTLNTLTTQNIHATQDVVIDGNLTVLGSSISAFTSDLYVEDNNIVINYNPSATTNVTSVNAGITIQDGDGNYNDVTYSIVRMGNLTGLTSTNIPDISEYSLSTGYSNRGWITELNDIIIRSTDSTDDGGPGSINGVRVLAEFDILDGGTF